jgi:hypothetical protein
VVVVFVEQGIVSGPRANMMLVLLTLMVVNLEDSLETLNRVVCLLILLFS